MSEKQIDKIAEIKDVEIFFKYLNCRVSEYLENCYRLTFNNELEDIDKGTIDSWEINGFSLVGFGIDDNKKLYANINVNQRRIIKGTVKQVLEIQ